MASGTRLNSGQRRGGLDARGTKPFDVSDCQGGAGMKMLSRALFAIAAVALVGGLVLGTVPIEVYPADAPPAVGRGKVSCGTAFSDTRWSGDDACEGPRIGQAGAAFIGPDPVCRTGLVC